MTRPATILHARIVTGAGGGPDKTVLRSATELDKGRYKAVAAYLHPKGDPGIETLRNSAARLGMQMHTVPERSPFDLRAVRLLLDLCEREKVAVWHAHDYKTDILGRLLCKRHPMKLVSTMHGFTGETWRTRLYARLANGALRGYDRVLAVSPQLMRYAAEHGVDPRKLRHIPNGIDLNECRRQQTREQAKYSLGLAKDEHAVGVIARFSPEKGIDRAIRAFADLHRICPNTRLHLIGDGPQRAELERLAEDLDVVYAIRWWGWQSDTKPITEALDTLLLPSHTEGLPNVVLEAMAMGLPVAATRVGAVPEVLDDGGCGVLLSNDGAEWAEQIAPLISQPFVREQFLCNAWVRVQDRYDFSRRMRRVEAIYDELLGLSPAARSLSQAA